MGITKIPYCDKSWNVTVGCIHAGMRGCGNCWARALHNQRHKAYLAGKKVPRQYSRPFGEIILRPDRLNEPLHWQKPCRVFVCSMSDLFHPLVPFDFIGQVIMNINLCSQHEFLIFTKRVKRAVEFCSEKILPLYTGMNILPRNIWFIVSCSTQEELDKNVSILLQIPVAVRGISLEPLIEEVNLLPKEFYDRSEDEDSPVACIACRCGEHWENPFGQRNLLCGIDWVIIGCESGKKRRPCNIEWVRKIVIDCNAANVHAYVKQLDIGGKVVTDVNKFPEDLRVREYPKKP